MDDDTGNIFEPPQAELETESLGWDEFPWFSTWWVLLLTIFTLYLYGLYWMYSRSQTFNRIYPDRPISNVLIFGLPVVWIGSLVLEMIDPFFDFALMSQYWSSPVSLVTSIAGIVWAFSIRERVNRLLFDTGQEMSAGPLGTFFLGHLFLNYKMNVGKEAADAQAGRGAVTSAI